MPQPALAHGGAERLLALDGNDVLTLRRQNAMVRPMDTPKRATVYFDVAIHQALRLKAAASDRSISDMVNDAVKVALAEDAEDLATFERRAKEPALSFEEVLKDMKRRGKL